MKQFGIIGKGLTHSFSRDYFNQKFKSLSLKNHSYLAYELENISEVNELFKNKNLVGLNVTIPFKEEIISYLDQLEGAAKKIRAVNTIHLINGRKIGYNTDVIGFEKLITPQLKSNHKNALILGTGGSAKAVEYILAKLNIGFSNVSRSNNNHLSYNDINEKVMNENQIIINTTPLGMYPAINFKPEIPYQFITQHHLIVDLIYNPEETLFLKLAKEKKATILNGYKMLIEQADASWEIWNK